MSLVENIFIGVLVFAVILLVLVLLYEVFNYFYIKHKEKKRLEALRKKNNPKGYKVGDKVHTVGLWIYDESKVYTILSTGTFDVILSGAGYVDYSYLRPHKKIYLGGE